MPEHAAAVRRQVINCRWRSVRFEIVGRSAYDHLDREKLPTDHALTGRRPNPETDIDAIQYPIADTVIELDVRLDTGVLAAELVEQRHEERGERRFRSNDAQRARDFILGLPCQGHGPVQCRQSGLGIFQKSLALLGQSEATRRPMQQTNS